MPRHVLTVVTGTVDAGREAELLAGFQELLSAAKPDGLLRTELLRGPGGEWQIQTLWRDREALDAMRAGTEPPAAPTLFRSVGADPRLQILEVELSGGLDRSPS